MILFMADNAKGCRINITGARVSVFLKSANNPNLQSNHGFYRGNHGFYMGNHRFSRDTEIAEKNTSGKENH